MSSSPLSRALDAVTKPSFRKRGFAEARILTDWRHIVGEVVARYSTPQKLVFPQDSTQGGTLHIDVYDSAFATEIHYLGPLILEKTATYFGYAAVAHIKITQKPMDINETEEKPRPVADTDEEALQALLEGVEDEAVRAALERLGSHVVLASATPTSTPRIKCEV